MADKTKYITIEGLCKWARLYPENMDTRFGDKYNVDFYPDKKSLLVLKESGFRGKRREDEDGEYYKLSRDDKNNIEGKGGPPKISGPDGSVFKETIGNGSTLSIILEVYPSKYGTGSRISSVTVKNHIPYVKEAQEDGPPVN